MDQITLKLMFLISLKLFFLIKEKKNENEKEAPYAEEQNVWRVLEQW